MFSLDELKIYRGEDIEITDKIIITQPTLHQIAEFGEQRYFSAVHTLTSVGADLKWQLWDLAKIDYTKIEDYDLFINFISQLVSSKKNLYKELNEHPEKYTKEISNLSEKDIDEMKINPLELVLKDIDFADFVPMKRKSQNNNEDIILYCHNKNITIDRYIYIQIVETIRKIHGLKRNNQIPANEKTKMDLIEDARDEAMLSASKPYKSMLLPLISALSVYCRQCGDDSIWNMKINMFFNNIKRIQKIQEATLLLQGAYSGFTSLKGIDKSHLDMFSEI